MKKLISIVMAFAMLCLIPGTAVFAAPDNSAIPTDVLAYAQGNGMTSIKEFMKRSGYVGRIFNSEAEIDALTLGQGYRLYYFDLNRASSLSACAKLTGDWLFSLDLNDEAAVWFGVAKEADGSLSYFGAEAAYNLSTALGILKRLAENEGVDYAPVISITSSGYVVAHSFGGSDKVITVPGSVFKLDDSYLAVTHSEELPAFSEYTSAYFSTFVPYYDPETGEPNTNLKSGSDEIEVKLLPHLNGSYSASVNTGTPAAEGSKLNLVPAIACSAAVLIVAAAVILGMRGKKKREAR